MVNNSHPLSNTYSSIAENACYYKINQNEIFFTYKENNLKNNFRSNCANKYFYRPAKHKVNRKFAYDLMD